MQQYSNYSSYGFHAVKCSQYWPSNVGSNKPKGGKSGIRIHEDSNGNIYTVGA